MMGGTFLEFMKSIGIFIICAQSFMHFAAGKAYEKYVKLLIGVMILAQFTVPVRAIFLGGQDAQIWEEIERFQKEMEDALQEAEADAAFAMKRGGAAEAGADAEKKALEGEIKERLADTAGLYGMDVEEVRITEDPAKVMVTVCQKTERKPGTGKIKVEKITVGPDTGKGTAEPAGNVEPAGSADSPETTGRELAEAFSGVLGTGAEYVEVTVK